MCDAVHLQKYGSCKLMNKKRLSHVFAQLCHGGIEPGYISEISEFLYSDDMFLILHDKKLDGFNWSDFSGKNMSKWTKSSRGAGFLIGINQCFNYFSATGIHIIFRGHQDMKCSLKLLKPNCIDPVPWNKQISKWKTHSVEKADCGVCKKITINLQDADQFQYENADKLERNTTSNTTPVFTLTSAKKIRNLPDDGFCVVTVDSSFSNWKLESYVCTDDQCEYSNPQPPDFTLSEWILSWDGCDISQLQSNLRSYLNVISNRIQPSPFSGRGFARKLIVKPKSRIVMIGDLHGCMDSLAQNLKRMLQLKLISNDWKLSNDTYLIFLGDLVDRGSHSLEVCITVAKLLFENREHCYCCRGNHEVQKDRLYTNKDNDDSLFCELKRRCPLYASSLLCDLNRLFAMFPDAIFLGC